MKKSNIATLIVFLLLIPLTLFLGTKLSGRSYYITGTLIIVELMIPFFMAFEGRKPQARELVVIAVMCALAIAGRVVIPIPHFKAAFAEIEEDDNDDEIKIIRTKKFGIKPMFPEDACVQMELLGHSFFVFCNAETDEVNVVYKRKGHTYGLIEPEC